MASPAREGRFQRRHGSGRTRAAWLLAAASLIGPLLLPAGVVAATRPGAASAATTTAEVPTPRPEIFEELEAPAPAAHVASAEEPNAAPEGPGDGHDHEHPTKGFAFRPPTAAERDAEGLQAVDGQCGGAYLSRATPHGAPFRDETAGATFCTHGGDYVSAGSPQAFASELAPGYSSPGIPCYSTGPFVHVYYGYRSSSPNRISTLGPRIRETVSRIDDIYAVAAAKVGGSRHVKWKMAGCKLVITAVALPSTLVNGEEPGPIRSYLLSHGFMTSAEKGLIFTDDGDFSCSGIAGIAEWADNESTSTSNPNNQGGMLARVFGWCWTGVGMIDLAAMVGTHELSHTLGAVGDGAPHSSFRTGGQAHCTQGIDLMCYNDGGGEPTATCADAFPPTLDCNKDDYFHPSPPAGSYLATHWNPAKNQFLSGAAPPGFEIPPRPGAAISSPAAGVVAGDVTVTATASAPADGAGILHVEFWMGNNLVGEDPSAPYTTTFDTIPDGFSGYPNGAVVKLVAVAVDTHGRTGPSSPVSFTIGNPKVRLLTPAAWSTLANQSVSWTAAASAGQGRTVSKVELLDYGSVIATDPSAPYGTTVSLDEGFHELTVRVTDNGGVIRESVPRTVLRGPSGPEVTLVSPSFYELVVAGTGLPQRLWATVVPRPGRTVTSVAFKANDTTLATDTTAPYEYIWTPDTAGSYDIVAVATDSAAATGTSEASAVEVVDAPGGLAVSLGPPTNNSNVSGLVPITVTPTVPGGWAVSSIDIQLDGSSYDTLFGPPWSTQIDVTGFVGKHVLRAVLNVENQTTFEYVSVASPGTVVTMPGAIAITSPANGATIAGQVTISGSVTGVDPSSVAPLDVVLGGALYLGSVWDPAFSDTFSLGTLEDGATTLQLVDSGFLGLSSPPIALTLANARAALTAPANGATITGTTTLTATASADGGNLVEQVRFFIDGVSIGGDATAPYQKSWSLDGVANGAHTLRADAILTDGRTLASTSRTVNVKVGSVTRLSGADRYATSAAISKASYAAGVPVAYIATGTGFADALSGAPVAGKLGGPILLVPGTAIPAVIATELTRLKPAKIVILGGTGAVSSGVATALDAYTTGTVSRLAGANRYATSAAISTANYAAGVPVAYIATGTGFADALSGAPVAGKLGGPILLVPSTSIPGVVATELTRLKPAKIVILGGTGAVSSSVATALDAYTTGTVTRLSGVDRYATSAAISKASYAANVPVVYIATGKGFADALSGAPVAGKLGGPILLVPGTTIPSAVATELTRLKPAKIVILGGTGAVSSGVQTSLGAYIP